MPLIDWIELVSSALGIIGALLLATRSRFAGWAFVAWFVSNVGWIAFGAGNQHWLFIAQQFIFTATSIIGMWQWLISPRLHARAKANAATAEVSPGSGMNTQRAHEVLRLVDFPGYYFQVVGNFVGPTYLQGVFKAPCRVAGGRPVRQTTRKWLLSAHMTPSELVQTAFKCVLTSYEHEAREQFRYRQQAVFGPHFNVERLAALCEQGDKALEVRA